MAVAATVRQIRPIRRHTERNTSSGSAVNTGFHGTFRPVLHRSVRIKDGRGIDPACGSGNFLTESYMALRRLENQVLYEKTRSDRGQFEGQISFGDVGSVVDPIQVSIQQFYGIEINDFAVTVAKTALWIAESQMMKETEDIVHMNLDFLPLKTNAYIVEGNALRIDWNDVILAEELNYIMGNPPFVGYSLQSKEQKADIKSIYVDENGKPYKTAGKIDYVAGWYFKASEFIDALLIMLLFLRCHQSEEDIFLWIICH